MTDDFWDGTNGFRTLLYLPPPVPGDPADSTATEDGIRQRARSRGLCLARKAVSDPQEVDDLLDRYPGAAVLVRPSLGGGTPGERLARRDHDLLEDLLTLGATLRLCDERTGADRPVRDDWSGRRAVLLPADPFDPFGPLRQDLQARREEACRRYAAHLAHECEVVHDLATYERFVDRELDADPLDPGVTVVIHREAFAAGPGLGPDGRVPADRSVLRRWLGRSRAGSGPHRRSPLWRWLERGTVIHSTHRVRPTDAEEPRRIREIEERAMEAQRDHHEHLEREHHRRLDIERRSRLLEQLREAEEERAYERRLGGGLRIGNVDVPDFLHEDTVDPDPAPRPRATGPVTATGDRSVALGGDSHGVHISGGAANTGMVGSGYRGAPGNAMRSARVPPVGAGPGRDPGRPLPHDGLFIRRSTAYGTRSLLGIPELIENGVLIGQDQIRFDDFVASRTDQVPGPPADEAVAVSHGIAAVPGDSKAREATTHFVEIALKSAAAPPGEAPVQEPLPVNLVFVVDTSYSMAGAKLDTVKAALQQIYRNLRPTDCLGIVTFATEVATLLPGTRKADLPEERFARIVSGMAVGGGTDINRGVQYGIAEIGRRASTARTVNRLYLFSDGDPTSGELNWTVIRRNLAARLRGDLTLSCFGFGADARMTELSALAGTAGGSSVFVTRPEDVGAGLLEDLERRDHLAAIDIQLRIDLDPEVEVWHLYGHDLVSDPRERIRVYREAAQAARIAREQHGTQVLPDLITGDKGIRIFAPDLAFGETYWVVLEVRVPDGWEPADGLGTATVQYADTLARQSRSRELALSEGTTLAEETVIVHAVGLRTSEVTYRALDDLYENDREAAGRRLDQHIEVLQQTYRSFPVEELVDDRVVLQKLRTLADGLGTAVAYTDGAAPAPGIRVMNHFAKVRSGAFTF
ncbi:VWA domain-containing protein [Streptomyces sp. NPDC089799]|uniref:VWA domain-containing protein n=1 Tax=Streptomyces sp. NPDC089799 TaxID=3155066 RepID=UPI003419C748